MNRKPRSKQVRPTMSDVRDSYRLLRDRAREGDVNAAGWLVMAAQNEKREPVK